MSAWKAHREERCDESKCFYCRDKPGTRGMSIRKAKQLAGVMRTPEGAMSMASLAALMGVPFMVSGRKKR